MKKAELRQAQQEELVVMATEELALANALYPAFNNPMEALGVLQEEVYEATKEWRSLLKEYEGVQFYLCEGQTKAAADCAVRVRVRALLMARELIQVAAMGTKFVDSEVLW